MNQEFRWLLGGLLRIRSLAHSQGKPAYPAAFSYASALLDPRQSVLFTGTDETGCHLFFPDDFPPARNLAVGMASDGIRYAICSAAAGGKIAVACQDLVRAPIPSAVALPSTGVLEDPAVRAHAFVGLGLVFLGIPHAGILIDTARLSGSPIVDPERLAAAAGAPLEPWGYRVVVMADGELRGFADLYYDDYRADGSDFPRLSEVCHSLFEDGLVGAFYSAIRAGALAAPHVGGVEPRDVLLVGLPDNLGDPVSFALLRWEDPEVQAVVRADPVVRGIGTVPPGHIRFVLPLSAADGALVWDEALASGTVGAA